MARLFRCLVFGFVWAFFMAAIGVNRFSLFWFLSIFPAFMFFELIEVIFFRQWANHSEKDQ